MKIDLTDAEKRRVVELYEQGVSTKEIKSALHCRREPISAAIKQHLGLDPNENLPRGKTRGKPAIKISKPEPPQDKKPQHYDGGQREDIIVNMAARNKYTDEQIARMADTTADLVRKTKERRKASIQTKHREYIKIQQERERIRNAPAEERKRRNARASAHNMMILAGLEPTEEALRALLKAVGEAV